jgi:hypothetical protein
LAPHLLPRAFAKGDALLHRGRHGTGQLRRVITQGVIACGRRSVEARLQVSQPTQRADDPPADRRDDRGNIGIGGRIALDKPRFEPFVGAIEIDPLKEDKVCRQLALAAQAVSAAVGGPVNAANAGLPPPRAGLPGIYFS